MAYQILSSDSPRQLREEGFLLEHLSQARLERHDAVAAHLQAALEAAQAVPLDPATGDYYPEIARLLEELRTALWRLDPHQYRRPYAVS